MNYNLEHVKSIFTIPLQRYNKNLNRAIVGGIFFHILTFFVNSRAKVPLTFARTQHYIFQVKERACASARGRAVHTSTKRLFDL